MIRRTTHAAIRLLSTDALKIHKAPVFTSSSISAGKYMLGGHTYVNSVTLRFASTSNTSTTGINFVSSAKETGTDGSASHNPNNTDTYTHETMDYSSSKYQSSGSSDTEKGETEPGVHMDETMGEGNLRHYNPWEVLGLSPGASPHLVRLKYHDLLQECHPEYVKHGKSPDIIRLNQINKAYEIITRSPTLDKKYRNLISDSQKIYYRILPEWMAKNVDEMPRYVSWVRWRAPTPLQVFLLLFGCYATGRLYVDFPVFTTVFLSCLIMDFLFHTMSAPFALSLLFLNALLTRKTYSMAWLLSPRELLQGPLSY
eukprot:Tbor_TRINITY_DN3080_c0_g1::TRINITY_DN3080_c0_g1_i2::g.17408::m.17408